MKHARWFKVLLFILPLWLATRSTGAETPFWYAAPATDWKAAIPIGNGRIGGMIFGEVRHEQVLLNESSIWCGPPVPLNNPRGPELIAQMRQLLFEGKYAEAEQICTKEFLDGSKAEDRSYQPLGFLRLEHDLPSDKAEHYRRELDYERAVATVTFEQDGVSYRREAFVSAPDQVLVIRLTASQPGKVSFHAGVDRPFGATVTTLDGNRLHISGQAAAAGGKYAGVKFDGLLQVIADGGTVSAVDQKLNVAGANSVTLLLTAATDYNFKQQESPLTRDRLDTCSRRITAAAAKSYDRLKTDHVADYTSLYRRSTLEIPGASNVNVPIDRRLQAAAGGGDDPELLSVYYHYCRYILISGSRAGGMPLNLQGVWNPLMIAPWRGDFHLNINIQEAYWFAEPGNLPECHEPMFSLTEALDRNGRETARVMLGTKRGFAAAHRTEGWTYTAPSQLPRYGMYVVGGAWCAQHLMEHYRFTQDREFLRQRALPVLRDAALFFVDWLVPNPKTGQLVSGPSTSPENRFRAPDGKTVSISMGPSHDQEIAWNALRDYLEACAALGVANEETREVQATLDKLALPKIGPDGRLLEWPEPFAEVEPGHRHLSHLFGMMPGNRISLQRTPELAEAVRKSLDYRLSHDYAAQGWSLGWTACLLARLRQGDRALDLMNHEYFGKAYPNMFVNAHGQVQVGDMMGVPLAMIELLLQSQVPPTSPDQGGVIELLPALPKQWSTGKATGLCARGGFVVDLAWQDGKLSSATIFSKAGGKCHVRYGTKFIELKTEPGKTYPVTF
jgi:alpha-L-fucosidase 2